MVKGVLHWEVEANESQPDRTKKNGHPLPEGEGHYRGGFDFSGLVQTARELRKKRTPAESIMWVAASNMVNLADERSAPTIVRFGRVAYSAQGR